jgi:hypothetical protein
MTTTADRPRDDRLTVALLRRTRELADATAALATALADQADQVDVLTLADTLRLVDVCADRLEQCHDHIRAVAAGQDDSQVAEGPPDAVAPLLDAAMGSLDGDPLRGGGLISAL